MEKPPYVQALEKNDPQLLEALTNLRDFVMKEGALSIKIKTLMTLLGDAILGHKDGVKAIAQRAREMGVSEAEIRETVHLAFLIGGMPGLVTGTNAYKE